MIRFLEPGGRVYSSVGASYENLLAYWTSRAFDNTGSISVNSGGGRYTGSCLRFSIANYQDNLKLYKLLDTQTTWGIAFAFKTSVIPGSQRVPIAAFESGNTGVISIALNTNGTLVVSRGDYTAIGVGTALATSSAAITVNTWYHIEMKVFMNASTGTLELRINSVPSIGPLTSQNTGTNANAVSIGYLANPINNTTNMNGHTFDFDDVIVWDGQATDANGIADINDFVGDYTLYWSLPTAAGTTTQFVPDSGSNYARVNETTPDSTSYVESNVIGNLDTYQMADIDVKTTVVKGVAVVSYMRKTDIGYSRQQLAVVRTGGTNYSHASAIDLVDNYQYSLRNWPKNPNTSAAWTVSDVNGIEAGQKVGS